MKRLAGFVVILSAILLTGCSDETVQEVVQDDYDGKSTNISSEKGSNVELNQQTLHPFKEISIRDSGIYGAGDGKILIHSDQLYLFDVKNQTIILHVPTRELRIPKYYSTNDGFCRVGSQLTGDEISTFYHCFDESLNQTAELNLNEQLNESFVILTSLSVSESGNQIAYATHDGLYVYDVLKDEKQTIIKFGVEQMQNDETLISIMNTKFFDGDRKIAFIGSSGGAKSQKMLGYISMVDLEELNFKTDLPLIEKIETSDTFIAFSEAVYPYDFGEPAGRVVLFDIKLGQIIEHELNDKHEASHVFLSDTGSYFVTTIQNDAGELLIRVYESKTGNLIDEITQDLGEAGEHNVITQVEAFDDPKMLIAVSISHQHEPIVNIYEL